MKKIYGILLTSCVALLAAFLSTFIPIGSVAIAIILGAVFANSVSIPEKFNEGITFSEKTLLAVAIALMGINLDFNVLTKLGFSTILLIIISLLATLIFAFFISKRKEFEKNFGLILGIGNGVCGSAAIAATKDIVKLDKEKSAIAIAIINLLGTVGLFVLPLIGVLLGFDDIQIGILLGNTLQSVGHAVAAGFGVNEIVGQSATIVKMGRILLLTPVIIWLVYYTSKQNITGNKALGNVEIPKFIFGFILFSILASTQMVPEVVVKSISWLAEVILLLAMSAIGLKISFKAIKQTG